MQKSALKSVNVQRTGKSILQMFAFSFFDGSHICRFLPILRPPTVPRSHFRHPKTKVFVLIISHLYLQILHSAWESMDSNFRFIVKKGLMDTYDIQLKTIADNYLSTQNKNAINAKVANNNT